MFRSELNFDQVHCLYVMVFGTETSCYWHVDDFEGEDSAEDNQNDLSNVKKKTFFIWNRTS